MDAAGYQDYRLNACGYSLGTTFAPNWMDWPMLYHGNPVPFQAGMVVFCHMILFNSGAGVAMPLGRTSLVTEAGPEPLTSDAHTSALQSLIRNSYAAICRTKQ